MNYKKFMEKVVETGLMTSRQANFLILRIVILVWGICIAVALFANNIGIGILSIFGLVLGAFLFVFMLQTATEDEESLNLINKVSKFWILGVIALCAVIVVFNVLHF